MMLRDHPSCAGLRQGVSSLLDQEAFGCRSQRAGMCPIRITSALEDRQEKFAWVKVRTVGNTQPLPRRPSKITATSGQVKPPPPDQVTDLKACILARRASPWRAHISKGGMSRPRKDWAHGTCWPQADASLRGEGNSLHAAGSAIKSSQTRTLHRPLRSSSQRRVAPR